MKTKIKVYNGDEFIKSYDTTHKPKIGNKLKFNGKWYIVSWVDDYSDHTEVIVEPEKKEFSSTFKTSVY